MPIIGPSSPNSEAPEDESDATANDDANPASSSNKEKQKVSIKTEKDDDSGVRPQLRRQRSKSPASTGNDRRKIRRISTVEGFANLTDCLERAIKTLADSMVQITSQIASPAPSTGPRPSTDPRARDVCNTRERGTIRRRIDGCSRG